MAMLGQLKTLLHRTRLMVLAAASAGALWAAPAMADGLIVVKADLARPTDARHYTYTPLTVTYHKVKITINGPLAVTEIEQEFYNDSDDQLEGDYVFPVPDGADIDKFSMDVNGKMTPADLLDKDAAAQIYEAIVRPPVGNGKDPALMEYVGRSMYKCRIFPLEPKKGKVVKISYTQLLRQRDGLLDYRYTLNSTKYSRKPIKDLQLAFTIDGKEPLTTVYSPTHMVDVKRDGNKATVNYRAQDTRPMNDFQLLIGRKQAQVGLSVMTYRPSRNEDGYFVMMASPTVDKTNVSLPRDVVFVVDTSGSMAGVKMRQARQALTTCVESLKANDRFDIVAFSDGVKPLFKQLQTADADNRRKASNWIRTLSAQGETALEPALKQALSERIDATSRQGQAAGEDPNRLFMIVFLSDGEPTSGETIPDKILGNFLADNKSNNVRLFTFGIGSQVNTRLLDDLAINSNGQSNYVLESEDIQNAVCTFFQKVQDPVLTHLKLDAASASIAGLYPNAMPDMFVGDQIVVFGKYSQAGTFPVTLSGRSASGKELKFSENLTFADAGSENAWIGKLWATRRVGALLEQIRTRGEKGELRQEVAQLARKFGLVTPYTAMLIIEEDQRGRLPLAYHLLGDLEQDSVALGRAQSYFKGLLDNRSSGDMALATAINTNSYRGVSSLEQLERVVEQRESRMKDQTSAERGSVAALAKTRPELQVDWNQPNAREQYEKQRKELMESGAKVYDNYAAMNRLVGDRAYFLSGDRWLDSSIRSGSVDRRIKFASDEYMKLLRTNRELGPVLALGKNVTFEFKGKVYEVTE